MEEKMLTFVIVVVAGLGILSVIAGKMHPETVDEEAHAKDMRGIPDKSSQVVGLAKIISVFFK